MIPDDFECSTTLEIMRDLVLCVADGHKYERSAIEAWFGKGKVRHLGQMLHSLRYNWRQTDY